jgi:uncharacterized protein (TIGR00290 family)
MSRVPTLVAWSSGKDGAWALAALRRSSEVEVAGLLTTISAPHDRVAMHAVRRALVETQADALGLPVTFVEIPSPCSDDDYAIVMARATAEARASGIRAIAFGDLFLEDVRRYRELHLAEAGLTPLFPLWGRPTAGLAEEMLAAGLKAVVTCVDPRALPPEVAGRAYDHALLGELPPAVDPCGENGEFHTFVWDGPGFRRPVRVHGGETVIRDGFVFADLLPGATS